MENPNLTKKILAEDSSLKDLIVNFVGNELDPEDEGITVQQIITVFADQFPEFVLAVAEENWISGYTQALKDVEFSKKNEKLSKK